MVGAAAADVAVHVAHDLLARRLGRRLQELGRFHDLPRLAVAALRHFLGDPGLLQRMRRVGRQALNGHYLGTLNATEGSYTAANCFAVHVYRAGAALRDATAVLRSSELELVADHPKEGRVRLRLCGDGVSVQGECRHGASSSGAILLPYMLCLTP